MKTCRKCGQEKAVSEFYKHSGMADGRLNQCKECKREYQRKHDRQKYRNDPEWREKERKRSRDKYRRLSGKWDKTTNTKKREAQWAVSNAIRDGRLDPPDECEECEHNFSEFRREAHHHDYDKPLDVTFLCSLCHSQSHTHSN